MSDVACNGGLRAREASAQGNRFLARPWGRGGPGLRPRPPSQAPGSGCGGLGGEAAWTGLSGGFTRCLGAGGSCSRPPSSTVQVPTPHQPCSDLWLCLRVLGFTDPPSLGPCHLRSEAGPAGALSKQAPRAHRQRRGQPSACRAAFEASGRLLRCGRPGPSRATLAWCDGRRVDSSSEGSGATSGTPMPQPPAPCGQTPAGRQRRSERRPLPGCGRRRHRAAPAAFLKPAHRVTASDTRPAASGAGLLLGYQ